MAQLLGAWRSAGARSGSVDLADGIRHLVLDGRLAQGTRLPPERELAAALGASRTLVGAAMTKLRGAGLVASRQGSGSWIELPARSPGTPEPEAGGLIDLARAVPPAAPGVAAAVDVARVRLVEMLAGHGYFDGGLPELRTGIADRFTARGLPTSPDQVIVTNGAHHAFVLALRLLAGPGDRVLVEQPTYPNALDAIKAANAIPVPVSMTAEGWDCEGIEAALRQASPRLGYLIPDFHNPTGALLDEDGRARLATAFRRANTPVVVDETLAEIVLDDEPMPAPFASFAGDWAITVGSASKTYWGGLRVGWLRAPRKMIHRLAVVRQGLDLGSAVFEQLVLAELVGRDDVLLRRRQDMRVLRDELVAAVRAYCPRWAFTVPRGGLNLWCRLPEPVGTRLAVSAVNFGVRLVPGGRFGAYGGLERWLRLPYTLPAAELTEAMRRVSQASASILDQGQLGHGLVPVA